MLGKKLFCLLFSLSLSLCGVAEAEDFVMIVNAENPMDSLKVEDIRDYYLKKKRVWPNGEGVRFIDRGRGSPIRKSFLSEILGQTAEEIELYWIGQKLYTGDSSPLHENRELTVIQFVAAFPGAIGYISSKTPLRNGRVKAVELIVSQ